MGIFVYLFGNKTRFLGATLDKNQILNEAMLEFAKEKANKNILNGTDIELGFTIAKIDYGNEFGAAQGLCELLEVGLNDLSSISFASNNFVQ